MLSGITVYYRGQITITRLGKKRVAASGMFTPVISVTNIELPKTHVVGGPPLPVTLFGTTVYGGALNADGTSLTFRGEKVSTTGE